MGQQEEFLSHGGKISYSYNTGNISGTDWGTSGIVTYGAYETNWCYNGGTITDSHPQTSGITNQSFVKTQSISKYNNSITISNCFNMGDIGSGTYTGAFLVNVPSGRMSVSINNCKYSKGPRAVYSTTSVSQSGNGTATEATIKQTLINTGKFKADSSNINRGFPILSWE